MDINIYMAPGELGSSLLLVAVLLLYTCIDGVLLPRFTCILILDNSELSRNQYNIQGVPKKVGPFFKRLSFVTKSK